MFTTQPTGPSRIRNSRRATFRAAGMAIIVLLGGQTFVSGASLCTQSQHLDDGTMASTMALPGGEMSQTDADTKTTADHPDDCDHSMPSGACVGCLAVVLRVSGIPDVASVVAAPIPTVTYRLYASVDSAPDARPPRA